MTVLVTGATGFVGRHLVQRVLHSNHEVRTLSRSSDNAFPSQVQHFRVDVNDAATLEAAMAGVDTVYHAASMVPGSGSETRMWNTNVEGTRNVAQVCLRAGVRRLVLVSSVAVYRAPLADRVFESAPIGGAAIYGRSKAMAELVAGDICRGRTELVIVRPCQLFGAMDRTGYSRRLLRRVQSHWLVTAGIRGRSFSLLHVSDAVDGLCAAGERQGIDGAIINLSSEERTSLLELAAVSSQLLGGKARAIQIPIPELLLRRAVSFLQAAKDLAHGRRSSLFKAYASGSTHGSVLFGGPLYDIQAARALINFSPKTSLEQGLIELITEKSLGRSTMSRNAIDRAAVTRP